MDDLPDYRVDPLAYELEERSRPDEMLMLRRLGDVACSVASSRRIVNVLDLCCGTGLSFERLVGNENVARIVGVDSCAEYLDFASQRFQSADPRPELILGDAVTSELPTCEWDVIILSSAYHHIENYRKTLFLSRVASLLGDSGVAVMAENILPMYVDDGGEDYVESVKLFYREVLACAKASDPCLSEYVEGLIRRVAKYGVDGDYEYKTSLPVLQEHLLASGLMISSIERVWPSHGALLQRCGGNFILVLRRAKGAWL